MAIPNKQFWAYWDKGMFDEALKCSVTEKKREENRLQTMLFGTPDQLKQTGAVTTISVGEFIYDYVMINPTVVAGIDFARTEDLSNLFSLSQFASQVDTTVLTGDIAQIQGYVAEQMLAIELQAKGHDIEFPTTSNNPGWDILVDGQPFQVKNLASPDGVRDHLENYPDIPVYVNEELAKYFEGNPSVYVSNISREEVLEATQSTLTHADDLLDFEIPLIALGVSSIYNVKRVWKDDVAINQAVFNVISDTSSRVVLGALGQKAGILVGTMLFGPAGGITGAMLGVFTGASQGGRLSTSVKRVFSKKQEQAVINALDTLIQKVISQIDIKLDIKKKKMGELRSELLESDANEAILNDAERRYQDELGYLKNKREELVKQRKSISSGSFTLEIIPSTMVTITKSGVHPVHYQDELKLLQQAVKELQKKL
ncbi:putative membrane protein [Bacillus mesophilus]|uniref:Glycine zipper family protein n=1 Tax=Bacillus mesophilus TaxID=1808955 RepID=A0A6M0Q4E6_9BACI|nr:hypothetical protein [Bacillus mesophilus]MBM7660384.1 putative membrane protein [Bacillus mesophilus]NEY71093.1 hypothetical protein [Bacillus mesophilus]